MSWPKVCVECGGKFYPHRERMFEHEQVTCGKAECQRKRKTRLQRERRAIALQKHLAAICDPHPHLVDVASVRSSRVKQRRSRLPHGAAKQRGSTVPQK